MAKPDAAIGNGLNKPIYFFLLFCVL